MTTSHIRSFMLLLLSMSLVSTVHAQNTPPHFLVAKHSRYGQDWDETINTEEPRIFSATLYLAGQGLTNAFLMPPGRNPIVMEGLGNFRTINRTLWWGEDESVIDEEFPPGTYQFNFATAQGPQVASLELPQIEEPPAPRMTNFWNLDYKSPDQPITLSWVPDIVGTTNYQVILEISGGGVTYFSTPGFWEDGKLDSSVSQITLPAGTLPGDSAVSGRITFLRQTDLKTNSVAGATGMAVYLKTTSFSLYTGLSAPRGEFGFETSVVSVSETNREAVIGISRSSGFGSVIAFVGTLAGTALPGKDYVDFHTSVFFPNGVTSTNITIELLDDYKLEGEETLQLRIGDGAGGASVGPNSNTVIKIRDNESAAAGTLQFRFPTTTAFETSKVARVHVMRTGGSKGHVSATYLSSSGKAVYPHDFSANRTGIVSFAPGETNKIISIGVVNDTLVEGTEMFGLVLTNLTGGALLGARKTTVVSIVDNDRGGEVALRSAALKVNEGKSNVVVSLARTGGFASGVSVLLTAIPKSASTNDFVAISEDVKFSAGETNKLVSIALKPDTLKEQSETFAVRLSSPRGGLRLGGLTNATVTIVDND